MRNALTLKNKILLYEIATTVEPTEELFCPLQFEQLLEKTVIVTDQISTVHEGSDLSASQEQYPNRTDADKIKIISDAKEKWSKFISTLDNNVKQSLEDNSFLRSNKCLLYSL